MYFLTIILRLVTNCDITCQELFDLLAAIPIWYSAFSAVSLYLVLQQEIYQSYTITDQCHKLMF